MRNDVVCPAAIADRGHRRELVAEVVGHEEGRVAEVLELAGEVAPRLRR